MKFALAALLAIFLLGGCGSSNPVGGNGETGSGVEGSPREQVESIGYGGVQSGELELWLSIDRFKPRHPEGAKIRVVGTFINHEGHLPEMDMAMQASGSLDGRPIESFGGLLLGTDYAVANYEGQTYEPSKNVFYGLKTKLEEAQKKGDEGNVAACVEAASGLNLASIARHFQIFPESELLNGTPITAVKANIDIPAAVDALIQMMEDPSCGAQLRAVGVPPVPWLEAAKPVLEREVGERQAVVMFDKHGVIRELFTRVRGKNAEGERIHVELHVKLLRVNEPDRSPETHGYAPFSQMLQKVGLDEAKLARADGGEILIGLVNGLVDMATAREGS